MSRDRYDRKSKSYVRVAGKAEKDFLKHHARGAKSTGACATCTALTRSVRIPGATPRDVSALMRWYLTTRQAAAAVRQE
jgi:hypothetical protein